MSEICDYVILQLYDGQSQGIKIGAYEAHTLGNIDENILWRGSKEVLKLAPQLFSVVQPLKTPLCAVHAMQAGGK